MYYGILHRTWPAALAPGSLPSCKQKVKWICSIGKRGLKEPGSIAGVGEPGSIRRGTSRPILRKVESLSMTCGASVRVVDGNGSSLLLSQPQTHFTHLTSDQQSVRLLAIQNTSLFDCSSFCQLFVLRHSLSLRTATIG
jgi:hypothetical protein